MNYSKRYLQKHSCYNKPEFSSKNSKGFVRYGISIFFWIFIFQLIIGFLGGWFAGSSSIVN